jgi:hypothetical protein
MREMDPQPADPLSPQDLGFPSPEVELATVWRADAATSTCCWM